MKITQTKACVRYSGSLRLFGVLLLTLALIAAGVQTGSVSAQTGDNQSTVVLQTASSRW